MKEPSNSYTYVLRWLVVAKQRSFDSTQALYLFVYIWNM